MMEPKKVVQWNQDMESKIEVVVKLIEEYVDVLSQSYCVVIDDLFTYD